MIYSSEAQGGRNWGTSAPLCLFSKGWELAVRPFQAESQI